MFDNQKGTGTTKKLLVTDTSAGGVAKWNDDGSVKQKRVTVKGGTFDFDARLEKGNFAAAIKAQAEQTWSKKPGTDRGFLGADAAGGVAGKQKAPLGDKEEYEPPKWGVVIEEDNMSRHEWPICIELGLPLRKNYRDVNASTNGGLSTTSIIAAKARAFEKQEADRKAAKEAEMQGLAKRADAKVQCQKLRNGKPCMKLCKDENALNLHIKLEHKGTD